MIILILSILTTVATLLNITMTVLALVDPHYKHGWDEIYILVYSAVVLTVCIYTIIGVAG